MELTFKNVMRYWEVFPLKTFECLYLYITENTFIGEENMDDRKKRDYLFQWFSSFIQDNGMDSIELIAYYNENFSMELYMSLMSLDVQYLIDTNVFKSDLEITSEDFHLFKKFSEYPLSLEESYQMGFDKVPYCHDFNSFTNLSKKNKIMYKLEVLYLFYKDDSLIKEIRQRRNYDLLLRETQLENGRKELYRYIHYFIMSTFEHLNKSSLDTILNTIGRDCFYTLLLLTMYRNDEENYFTGINEFYPMIMNYLEKVFDTIELFEFKSINKFSLLLIKNDVKYRLPFKNDFTLDSVNNEITKIFSNKLYLLLNKFNVTDSTEKVTFFNDLEIYKISLYGFNPTFLVSFHRDNFTTKELYTSEAIRFNIINKFNE